MFRRFFTRPEGAPAPRRSHRRRPALEALEGRALLSFVGPETRVSLNPQTTDNALSDVASSSNGTSVAVWENAYSASDHDIWAQRLDSNGQPTGAPIQVDFTTALSVAPRVAMDSQGRFAVTWDNINRDGTYSVMMRYFSATGSPLTGITQLSAAGSKDFTPDVAASNGSIVVTWTHQFSTSDNDIYAERFVTSSGVPQAQGIFFVNIDTNDERVPSVAMSPDGRFDIAYQRSFGANDSDIFASQYDGNGALVRLNLPINAFDGQPEYSPNVAMDANGNAVIVYERSNGHDLDTYANRLSSSGAIGGLINLQDGFGINEYNPSVALSSTGQFVVAYSSDAGMEVVEVGSNDTVLTAQGAGNASNPSVSIDSLGGFVVTYARFNPTTGHQDIFSRRDVIDRHFS